LEGDWFVRRQGFTLLELMVGASMLAVLAVVMVPSFFKYQRRAKTTEALEYLDKLLKGAAAYYATPYMNETGQAMACRFPKTQGPTPVEATCCGAHGGPDADEDDRCDADPELWHTPTWTALAFELRVSHYFVYSFATEGEGDNASFDATANADLDCDQERSTFEWRAFGFANPTNLDCGIGTTPYLFINDETE
jgi:prepilin-type N-terminal cleavage/methylation domain-containing protein